MYLFFEKGIEETTVDKKRWTRGHHPHIARRKRQKRAYIQTTVPNPPSQYTVLQMTTQDPERFSNRTHKVVPATSVSHEFTVAVSASAGASLRLPKCVACHARFQVFFLAVRPPPAPP